MAKEKEEVIPVAGPGSKIKALAPTVRKHFKFEGAAVFVDFSTTSVKALPAEPYESLLVNFLVDSQRRVECEET
jgi:hypothetical protein